MYLKIDKKKVEDSFGKNATFYDDRTSLQKEILVKLNNYLFDDKIITKQQNLNLLDLGCGTENFQKIKSKSKFKKNSPFGSIFADVKSCKKKNKFR